MSNELATQESVDQLLATQRQAAAEAASKTLPDRFPQVRFYSADTDAVENEEIEANNFALTIENEIQQCLGESFECLVISERYRAQSFPQKGKNDPVTIVFDPECDEAVYIEAAIKARRKDLIYGVGKEFLCYKAGLGFFVLFFGASKGDRKTARAMSQKNLIGPCELTHVLHKYSFPDPNQTEEDQKANGINWKEKKGRKAMLTAINDEVDYPDSEMCAKAIRKFESELPVVPVEEYNEDVQDEG